MHKLLKTTIVLLLILFYSGVYGQVDSLENQIMEYEDTKSSMISKGRNLILDTFLEKDISKVKDLKDYLMKKGENENYIALYPIEYWLILYWTNEYKELSNSLQKFDSDKAASYNHKIAPPYDMLHKKLQNQSQENFSKLKSQIKESDLPEEEKDFLTLNLKNLTFDIDSNEYLQDTLNVHANSFLKRYPESKYSYFTKKFIKFKLVPTDWGMAFEFFSGFGIFTQGLNENYTNNIPIGVAFDIYYKKFELYLRDYIGFNKTRKNLDYSGGTWEKDSRTLIILPEASLGYPIFDNDRYKISPFAGIGAMDISPVDNDIEENPDLEEMSLTFTTNYLTGLNFDIKFGEKSTPDFRPKSSYSFIRIRYAFSHTRFQEKNDGISGNMHYITIGFGGLGRRLIKKEN